MGAPMRRLVPVIVLAVVLGACTHLRGPSAPLAREQFVAAAGLETSIAKDMAERFVVAYADAPKDGGRELASLVTGPKLAAWVHWLGVQDREFQGTIAGRPEIRHVAFVGELRTGSTTGAEVALDASVNFTYRPTGQASFSRSRDLTGPLILVQTGPVDWKVFDATRDGALMSDGIDLFDHVAIQADGVTIRLESVFLFAPNWQFNVVVTNRSGSEIQLDTDRMGLYVKTGAKSYGRVDGVATGSLAAIAPHTTVEGLMAFPGQASAKGRVLSIAYRAGRRALPPFAFPLQGIVTLPSPAPTSPPPVPSPS